MSLIALRKTARMQTVVLLGSDAFRMDPFGTLRERIMAMPEGEEKQKKAQNLEEYDRTFRGNLRIAAGTFSRMAGITVFTQNIAGFKFAPMQGGRMFKPIGDIPDPALAKAFAAYGNPCRISDALQVPDGKLVDLAVVATTAKNNINQETGEPIKPQYVDVWCLPIDVYKAVEDGIWAEDIYERGMLVAAGRDRMATGLRLRDNIQFVVNPNGRGNEKYMGRARSGKWAFTGFVPLDKEGKPVATPVPCRLTEMPKTYQAEVVAGRGTWTDAEIALPVASAQAKASADRTGLKPSEFRFMGKVIDTRSLLGFKAEEALTDDLVTERVLKLCERDEVGKFVNPELQNAAWQTAARAFRAAGHTEESRGLAIIFDRNHEQMVEDAGNVLLEEVAAAKAKAEADAAEAAKKAAEGGDKNPPNGSESGKDGSGATTASQPEGGVADPPTRDGAAV